MLELNAQDHVEIMLEDIGVLQKRPEKHSCYHCTQDQGY